MTFGIASKDLEKIRNVFFRHPNVMKVILYGSRAKGTHRPNSDIDLVLEGVDLEHRELTRILDELDECLLPYKMDVSLLSSLHQEDLLDHIRRIGKVFYSRKTMVSTE